MRYSDVTDAHILVAAVSYANILIPALVVDTVSSSIIVQYAFV